MNGNKTTPESILLEWGISPTIAVLFGLQWVESDHAYIYPSQPSKRNRMMMTKGHTKYIWDPKTSHLDMPPLFNAQILAANDTVYVANGEKSTLAMITADVPNTISTFGEGARMLEAIKQCAANNVQTLINIPDCDKTGLYTAWKWQQLGHKYGIKIITLDLRPFFENTLGLPKEKYTSYDTRDLWLHVNQNKKSFHAALKALPPLDFEQYKDEFDPHKKESSTQEQYTLPPPKHRYQNYTYIDWEHEYQEWRREVLEALDQVSPKPHRNKWHRPCPNPHHEDRHPSFRITKEGAPICTCQHTISWSTLADWVGVITWKERKKDLLAQARNARKNQIRNKSKSINHFPEGVPDILREQLMTLHKSGYVHDHASAALTYDLWHIGIQEKKWNPQQPITIRALQKLAEEHDHSTSYQAIRKGITQLIGLGFWKQDEQLIYGRGHPIKQFRACPLQKAIPYFLTEMAYRLREDTFKDKIPDRVTEEWFPEDDDTTAERLAIHLNFQRSELYKRYADKIQKAVKTYQKKVRHLYRTYRIKNLLKKHSSILRSKEDDWRNGKAYRDSYYKLQAIRRSEDNKRITVRKAAEQIGVDPRSLSSIRQRTGIIADPQFEMYPIQSPKNTVEQVDKTAPWTKGRRYGRWLYSENGEFCRLDPESPEDYDNWVKQQLNQGYEVQAKIQVASQERPATLKEAKALLKKYEEKRAKAREYANPVIKEGHLPLPEECMSARFTHRYIAQQLDFSGCNHYSHLKIQIPETVPNLNDLFQLMYPFKEDMSPLEICGKYENKSQGGPSPPS